MELEEREAIANGRLQFGSGLVGSSRLDLNSLVVEEERNGDGEREFIGGFAVRYIWNKVA